MLSTAMTREMLRVQVNPRIEGAPAGGPETQTGLGWFLGEESDPARFEHSGVSIGFAAKLLMWDSGHGVVVMANNWAFETECLMRYVINAVAREYGWSYRVPTCTPWPYANTVPDYPPTEWDLFGLAQAIGDPKHRHEGRATRVPTVRARAFSEIYVRSGRKDLAIQSYPADPAGSR